MKPAADIQQASAYLAGSAELRSTLGISPNALLVPHPLGKGEHNCNYWFEHPGTKARLVLRINVTPQSFHNNQVAYEYSALQALLPSGCTPEPLFMDCSPAAPGEGALVISFCEGQELDFDNLRAGDLRCAAQLMADVHSVEVAADCPLHRPADPLAGLFDECMQRYQGYLRSGNEIPRVTAWAERFIKATKPMLNTPCNPNICCHIINSETLPSHFLIPADSAAEAAAVKTGRFGTHPGAFIDWERPLIGEVAQDVAYFIAPTTTFWDSEFIFTPEQAAGLVEDYWQAVDGRFSRDGFDERLKAWGMMTALRSTTWFCKMVGQFGSTVKEHVSEKTASKFDMYLSDGFMEMLAHDCFGI